MDADSHGWAERHPMPRNGSSWWNHEGTQTDTNYADLNPPGLPGLLFKNRHPADRLNLHAAKHQWLASPADVDEASRLVGL